MGHLRYSVRTALLKIIKRVFSEQPLKKQKPKMPKLGSSHRSGYETDAGAAAKAVMKLMQERLSDP
jgi:hypothetical protein